MWVGALPHFPQSWNVSIPPTLLPQQTCFFVFFFILSNRFFPLKSWWRGGGKWPFGPQDKLIEKCWHQMKGGLLTWWVGFLPLASAACWDHVSARLSQGLLISRPWDEAWGTPPRPDYDTPSPQKKDHLHPLSPPQCFSSTFQSQQQEWWGSKCKGVRK